jgi:hypothetical protein
MGMLWRLLVRYAVKVAVYAAGHPDQVRAVVAEIAALRAATKSK